MTKAEQTRAAMTRLNYPPGTRLELISMGNAPDPVPPGTRGTVQQVNCLGDIEVQWDNGRSLSLIPSADSFRKLTLEELEAEQDMGGIGWQTM